MTITSSPHSSSARPVAVLGATGAQGGPVVRALLAAGRPVRAIARTEHKLADLAAAGAQTAAVDLADAAAVTRALEGVAGAFVHLPIVPVPEVVRALTGAVVTGLRDADVPLAVFTLSGPAATAPVGVATFDTKAVAKAVVTDAAGSGVPVIGFEPTSYLGNLSAPFSAPSVVHHGELRYPLPADHRQPWISTEDQAALAVAALGRPDLAGRWFALGEQLTGPDLADRVGEGLGTTVRYVPLDPDDFGRSLAPVLGAEIGAALAADYRLLGTRPDALPLDADTRAVRDELGVAATPVAEWARTQDWRGAAALGAA